MGKYYLSKNYKEVSSAGNKAKTDIEKILSDMGYKPAGLKQSRYSNEIIGFFLTLMGVIKLLFTVSKNDVVVLQYPFKKYFSFACKIIHLKKGKIITIIHDLGSFRRKKLSAKKEIKLLNNADFLIVHNTFMKEWLLGQGHSKPVICLGIFDYLSSSVNKKVNMFEAQSIRVVYAGALSYKKNKYLYLLDDITLKWQLEVYGNGFNEEKIKNKEKIIYKGFCPSEKFIENVCAGFGLVWDGDSVEDCSNNFEEYLKYNNPHKASFYIRCNLPLIIWSKAALASFVTEKNIGICVDSLSELNAILPALSVESYNEMRNNVMEINKKISSGFYIKAALSHLDF